MEIMKIIWLFPGAFWFMATTVDVVIGGNYRADLVIGLVYLLLAYQER